MQIALDDPEFKANAWSTYASLRSRDPVHCTVLNEQRIWLLTRYEDAVTALKDGRLVRSRRNTLPPEQRTQPRPEQQLTRRLTSHMHHSDPPDHTRLRSVAQRSFTPLQVERLRGRIQRIADELLDALQGRGEMDILADYAVPLTRTVIAEVLGIPGEVRDELFRFAGSLVTAATRTQEDRRAFARSMLAYFEHLRVIFARKREQPGDDLISALVHAHIHEHTLSEDELFSTISFLLVAGQETAANLIGNGMLALFEHPAQRDKLRNDPALIESAVEEFLRYYSPAELVSLFASEDIALHGKTLSRGDTVAVVFAAANRDPAQFEEPDTLDITRKNNKHLGLGVGIHYCLGASLARIEGQLGIATLLRRLPALEWKHGREALAWRPDLLIRGLESLPVSF